MTFSPPPCKDCLRRSVGCHSGCRAWNEWKAEEARKRSQFDKFLSRERMFREASAERDAKILRRQRGKR